MQLVNSGTNERTTMLLALPQLQRVNVRTTHGGQRTGDPAGNAL